MIRTHRVLVLAAVVVIAFVQVSVVAAGAATPGTVGSATPGATSSPASGTTVTPVPTAGATATPTPPIINGLPCKSGRLMNGFLIVGRADPLPECSEAVTASVTPVLYGLRDSPGYRLIYAGPVGGTAPPGNIYAEYVSTSGPSAGTPGAIVIGVRPRYDNPPVVQIREGVDAQPVGYLPVPGIALTNIEIPEAEWIGPGGLYGISVDPRLTSLTLADVAKLLTPIQPTSSAPLAPNTGSGSAASTGSSALDIAGVSAAFAGLLLLGECRRRVMRHRRHGLEA